MKTTTHMYAAKNDSTQLSHTKGNTYVSGQGMLVCSAKDSYCSAGRMILGVRNTVPGVRRQIPEVPFKGSQQCWNNS